jgi:hypothetical protein
VFEDYAVLPVEPEANDGLIVKYEHVVDQQCVDGEAELKGDEGVRREYQFAVGRVLTIENERR